MTRSALTRTTPRRSGPTPLPQDSSAKQQHSQLRRLLKQHQRPGNHTLISRRALLRRKHNFELPLQYPIITLLVLVLKTPPMNCVITVPREGRP